MSFQEESPTAPGGPRPGSAGGILLRSLGLDKGAPELPRRWTRARPAGTVALDATTPWREPSEKEPTHARPGRRRIVPDAGLGKEALRPEKHCRRLLL